MDITQVLSNDQEKVVPDTVGSEEGAPRLSEPKVTGPTLNSRLILGRKNDNPHRWSVWGYDH